MAERSVHDEVDQIQSVGDRSPSDVPAATNNLLATGVGAAENKTLEAVDNVTQEQPVTDDHAEGVEQLSKVASFTNGLSGQTFPINGDDLRASTPDSQGLATHIEHESGLLADHASASDTDNSRAEASAAEDGKVHESASAPKKPFKPVSFNKQRFPQSRLGPVSASPHANGDKAAASSTNPTTTNTPQGIRPRLVAKSTSGLGASALKNKLSGKNGIPDPMQVWNKNRVTPQPSTKHLTDEELKQQYGIHMTSRIQTDADGKEAKWADIDDDEDDWAPETIEWGDGTKVTVNQADAMPPPKASSQSTIPDDDKSSMQGGKTLSSTPTTTIGPNATILKLGANAERQQAQKAAIMQKGPTEKAVHPTMKVPAPLPAKSPWASLPPVDKVSPVIVNLQPSVPPTSYFMNQRSGQSPSAMAMPSPAKEIAPDDFNRSWRDGPPSQPPSLYMPNSGKYEAVNESNRRRSSRNEQNFRAPAVLQRPSQSDSYAPAEPSAAFQTNRNSTDQERQPWSRRRASSNLSATSGSIVRRMSLSKPSDLSAMPNDILQERRGSHATGSDSVGSSQDFHRQMQNATGQAWEESPYPGGRTQSRTSDSVHMNGVSQSNTVDIEAERARQRQLMKERNGKAALERRRRLEAEEHEERERRERLRLKMAALGPPPDKPKPQEAPLEISETPATAATDTAQSVSPPKSFVLDNTNAPVQYGMMKVHPPEIVRKAEAYSQPQRNSGVPTAQPNDVSQTSNQTSNPMSAQDSSALSNGFSSVESNIVHLPVTTSMSDKGTSTIKSALLGPEPRSGWLNSRNDHRSPPTASLWGPPSNNKALGNGTFDQTLAGFPSRDFGQRENGWSSSIASGSEISPQLSAGLRQTPMDRAHSVPSHPPAEQSPLAANSEIDSVYPSARPTPIGPPPIGPSQSHPPSNRWQISPNMRPANSGISAWQDFHNVAAREDKAESERAQREMLLRQEEEARTGLRRAPQYTFNETWKQVEVGDQAGQRQVTGIAQSSFTPSLLPGNQFGAVGSLPGPEPATKSLNNSSIRGSRFFPHLTDGVNAQPRRAVTYSHTEISRTPSPPLAEEYASGHPAFDGDIKRPVVQFPPVKPVVKLPPPKQAASPEPQTPAAPLSFAAALASSPPQLPQQPLPPPPPQPSIRAVSTQVTRMASWQQRFDNLVGRRASPEKRIHTLAVTPFSREPLEVMPALMMASVSLPPQEDDILTDAGQVTSKDVEDEEEMFEDREAGSLPIVKFPQMAPQAAWAPVRNTKLRQPSASELPHTAIPFLIEYLDEFQSRHEKRVATIRLPGAKKVVKKELPPKPGSARNSMTPIKSSVNNSPAYANGKHRKGGQRSRETSATHTPQPGMGKNAQTQPPLPNGSISSPRPGPPYHHNRGWHNNQKTTPGVVH